MYCSFQLKQCIIPYSKTMHCFLKQNSMHYSIYLHNALLLICKEMYYFDYQHSALFPICKEMHCFVYQHNASFLSAKTIYFAIYIIGTSINCSIKHFSSSKSNVHTIPRQVSLKQMCRLTQSYILDKKCSIKINQRKIIQKTEQG